MPFGFGDSVPEWNGYNFGNPAGGISPALLAAVSENRRTAVSGDGNYQLSYYGGAPSYTSNGGDDWNATYDNPEYWVNDLHEGPGAAVRVYDKNGNFVRNEVGSGIISPLQGVLMVAGAGLGFGALGAAAGGGAAAGEAAGAAGAGEAAGAAGAGGAGVTGFGDAGAMYGGLNAGSAGSLGGGASVGGGSALGTAAAGAGAASPSWIDLLKSGASSFLGNGGGGVSWTDLIGPAMQAIGGAYQANQAGNAADAQVQAANNGIAENRRQFDVVRQLLAPYVNAGTDSLGGYRGLAGVDGPQAQQAAIAALQASPQFGALTQQGEDAILQNASATGGLRGGNVQTGLANYRTNVLSGLIDQQLGRYGSLINIGQNSAAGTGSAAMTTGANNAQLMQQAGAAQAGGIVAGSNAITNALGGVGGFAAGSGWRPNTTAPASGGYGGAGISGGGGFGTGVVYGNQDYGQYF